LVKQSPDQLFLWQMGVDQLHRLDRLGEDRDVLPFGVVHANVKPLAPLLALGEVLKQKTAGDGSSVVKSHRRANQRRNLLAPREVSFDRGRKRFPLERDHALIAMLAFRRLESDREVADAEQVLQAWLRREVGGLSGIVPHVATQLAVAVV